MSQEIDIEKYHQLALQKQKEHRKVFMTRFSKKSIVQLAPTAVRP